MKNLIITILLILTNLISKSADFYWVNGTGNWSDYANHWATSTGGSIFHVQPPQPTDDVYFDANSFTSTGQIVSLDLVYEFCRNLSWENTPSGSDISGTSATNEIHIYGSINIGINTNLNFSGTFSFESATTGNTINIDDTLLNTLKFNSPSGEWTLTAPLAMKGYQNWSTPEGGAIFLSAGTLNTGNYPVTLTQFISNNGNADRTLITGNSTIKLKSSTYLSTIAPATWEAIWDTDSLLNFNGLTNDLILENPDGFDSSSFMGGPYLYCIFKIALGNTGFKSFYCSAPDSLYQFPVLTELEIAGGKVETNSVRFENARFSVNSTTFNADTVICASTREDLGLAEFFTQGNLHVNFVEATSINISVAEDSTFLPEVISSGTVSIITGWTFPPGGVTYTNNIGNVLVGTDAYLGNVQIRKCTIGGNGTFNSSCTFDTLMFTAGHTYVINEDDTVTVNDNFIAFGDPLNPIQLNSQITGSQAYIQFNQNDVCSDYLYLRDMVALGTNVSAGTHSLDLSNNSGWQFTPCSVISDVWPGDANYDLVVNNMDLLPVGLAYGDTGAVRPNASLSYIAQPATDWAGFFNTAVNKKHADCDGNGLVDGNDTIAIALNYSLTHPAKPFVNTVTKNTGAELFFQMPVVPVSPGSTISIPVMLGTAVSPVASIYGIAFSITYDPTFIVAGSLSVDYSGSWIAAPGNYLNIEKDFTSSGKYDMAFTKMDHTDAGGQGLIATIHFTISQNANGILNLSFSNIMALMHNGSQVPVIAGRGFVSTSIKDLPSAITSLFYPDPMHDQARIVFSNPDRDDYLLFITDATGRQIMEVQHTSSGEIILKRNDLTNGIYFYELRNESGTKSGRNKFLVN
jgi:hypothetical protein